VTVENIKESGNMENNMGKANSLILKQKPGKREYGVMEGECNGIILHFLRLAV